jgi:DNA modification methylase
MELTLHNGDCLEVMKTIPDKSVDLIICDLPYGCLTAQKGATPFGRNVKGPSNSGCSWDIKIDLEEFWKQVKRIRRSEHSPTIHFCTTKFGYELIKSNPDEFRYDLVWDKQRGVSFLSANKMPMRSHEMMYIFSKAGAFYERKDFTGDFKQSGPKSRKEDASTQYGTKRTKEVKDNTGKRCVLSVVQPPHYMKFVEHKQYGKAKSDSTYGVVNRKTPVTRPVGTITSTADKRCVLSVVEHPEPKVHKRSDTSNVYPKLKDTAWANKDTDTRCAVSVIKQSGGLKKGNHPTEKPEALYRFLIERYCPVGGMVLDPTFGSGNSVFTAFAMDRSAIGIEKDEVFFKKAEERLNALP